jgi:sporulation protein YlmC with PRC-barrel domain
MRKNHRVVAVVVAITILGVVAEMPFTLADGNSAPARADQPESSAPTDNPPTDNPAAGNPVAGSPAANPPGNSPAVVILKSHELEGILGKEVRSATGENMGRIVDVVVDRNGQVRAAVIDFGGFLGVGSRKIAVDWDAVKFPQPSDKSGHVTPRISGRQAGGGAGLSRQARAVFISIVR